MASVTSPLGPYFGDAGDLLPGGLISFLDPSTDIPKTIYADEAWTTPLLNPAPLGSDSCLEDQPFLGYGGYKVVLYRVVDENIVSPVFPTDYAMVRTWLQDGVPVPVVPPVSMYTVGTIAELSALDPADVDDLCVGSRQYRHQRWRLRGPRIGLRDRAVGSQVPIPGG